MGENEAWYPWRGSWEDERADEEVVEVFSHFGRAYYYAHMLEGALSHLLLTDRLDRGVEMTGEEIDVFLAEQDEKPLGPLVKKLDAEIGGLPGDLRAKIEECRKRRNYLAHQFFRDHAYAFFDSEGRRVMVGQLKKDEELLRRTTERVNDLVRSCEGSLSEEDVSMIAEAAANAWSSG